MLRNKEKNQELQNLVNPMLEQYIIEQAKKEYTQEVTRKLAKPTKPTKPAKPTKPETSSTKLKGVNYIKPGNKGGSEGSYRARVKVKLSNGKYKEFSRQFSIEDYGNESAKQKAVDFRKKILNNKQILIKAAQKEDEECVIL